MDSPTPTEPGREEVDRLTGLTVLEFGSRGCGHCLRAQPLIERALASVSDLRHLKIEDGRGRPLGRSFGVKLWPTLVFMVDGHEVSRVVRPTELAPLQTALSIAHSNHRR